MGKEQFKPGEKVERVEDGKKGTVRRQFEDGSVSLVFEGGWAAEVSANALRSAEESHRKTGK